MLFALFLAAAQDFEALENGTSEKSSPLGTETEEGKEGEGENSGTENMVNIFSLYATRCEAFNFPVIFCVMHYSVVCLLQIINSMHIF